MARTGKETATEADVDRGIRGKLVEDFRAVVTDAEELLKATASRRLTPSARHLDPRQAERIQRVMTPLIQHTSHPLVPSSRLPTVISLLSSRHKGTR